MPEVRQGCKYVLSAIASEWMVRRRAMAAFLDHTLPSPLRMSYAYIPDLRVLHGYLLIYRFKIVI